MVQFGILDSHGDPHEMLERAVRAEELGFDSIFTGHHRFTPGFGLTQHPWIVLSAIAARTEGLRLATSIFLLPLTHPLDVAEEVASLDILSKGRVIFGPGVGYRAYEYEAVGLRFNRRGRMMDECLQIVQGVWEHEQFSFKGDFYSFENVTVTPRPMQQPRIPIWVGANVDRAMERAARLADGWIVGFSDRLPKLVPRLERYRSLAAQHGQQSTVCLMRLIGLRETREAAETEWLPTVYQQLRNYAKAQAPSDRGDQTEKSLKGARWGTISLGEMGNDLLIAGNPDDVISGIQRAIDETGCDHIVVSTGEEVTMEMLELFAREVMPAFR